jgi:hypothetical protein
MRDDLTIGSAPCDEDCAQVGQPHDIWQARQECQRFIQLIRKTLGPEPEGARLAVTSFPHEFGDDLEVVCYFDTHVPDAVDYASRCESDAPAMWEG